jgi:hypothetical protein
VASAIEGGVLLTGSERMRGYRHAAGVWTLAARATVKRAGRVAAREVLPADAANLPSTTRAGERTETDAQTPPPTVRGVSTEREAMPGSGMARGIASIADARGVMP